MVVAAASGDYGKPRPHLVVQNDDLNAAHESIMLCPITSTLHEVPFRVDIPAGAETGLRQPSQVVAEKVLTVRRERVRAVIGRADPQTLQRVNRALTLTLGLADAD